MCQSWCCRFNMMPKYVCFKCRKTMKARKREKTFFFDGGACPRCRKAMVCIGGGPRPPVRTNLKAWKKLEAWFYKEREPYRMTSNQRLVASVKVKK